MSDDQSHRLEEAALWHMRLGDDAHPTEEFLAWLDEPLNCTAFNSVAAGWTVFDDQDASPELIALRQAALAGVGVGGVGVGGVGRNAARGWARFPLRRRLLQAAAAAILIVATASTVWPGVWSTVWSGFFQGRETYTTALGERRVFTLSDGSRIALDSNTRLAMHYTGHSRALRLDRGQARFDVTHDVTRPFTVAVGGETVVAVGTSFNVERLGAKVVVTLIEGQVVVNNTDDRAAEPAGVSAVPLSAGQTLISAHGQRPVVVSANVRAATAWQNGMLIFSDDSLSDAVAKINRYTDHPISVDPAVAGLHISGAFNAGDTQAFIEAVTMYFPIEATMRDDDRVVFRRRN